jgi:hypothetical protein
MTSTALSGPDASVAAPTRRDLDNIFFLEWMARLAGVYTTPDGIRVRVRVHRGAYLEVRSVHADRVASYTLHDLMATSVYTAQLSVREMRGVRPISRLEPDPRLRLAAERQRRRLWPRFIACVDQANQRTDTDITAAGDDYVLRFISDITFRDLAWFASRLPQIGAGCFGFLFGRSPVQATRLVEQWIAGGEVDRLARIGDGMREMLSGLWGMRVMPRLWKIQDALLAAGITGSGRPLTIPTIGAAEAANRLTHAQKTLPAPVEDGDVMADLVRLGNTVPAAFFTHDQCEALTHWLLRNLPSHTPTGEQAFIRSLDAATLQHDAALATRWCREVLGRADLMGAAASRAYVDSGVARTHERQRGREQQVVQHMRVEMPDGSCPGVLVVRIFRGYRRGMQNLWLMRADSFEVGIAAMEELGFLVGLESWLAMPEAERDARAMQWCTGAAS